MARVDTKPTKPTSHEGDTGRKVTTFLTFKDNAEEAITLYTSLIPNSRIVSIMRGDGQAVPKNQVLHAIFELDGQRFMAMDGGSSFSFTEGASLFVDCKNQEEVDRLWDKLTANGGKAGPCGWLTDKFGVSWQIIPSALGQMMSDSEHGNSRKAMEAMLKMSKIDVKELERAYNQKD